MEAGIEDVAKSWLIDPAWQKVFKHTFDVVEDYISYLLITAGALALSVRLLDTVGSGDLQCMIVGVENATQASLGPYPAGGTLGLINYAQTEQKCIDAALSPFRQHLPFIMLMQTLVLLIVEKFTFKIPHIAQKVERFYKNIVDESLFGKDPDVAEDMTDPKTSTEAISRRRQRNEICMSLKRSSIIHHVYLVKNFVEILICILFLCINLKHALLPQEPNSRCGIAIQAFPGIVDENGLIYFQCRGKKMAFFNAALWVQIVLLVLHLLMSLGAMVWCWKFRPISRLLQTIKESQDESELEVIKEDDGEDFLFLFDLLSHSCGIECTLRVLTHSDDTFYRICRPKINWKSHLKLEEDRVKVTWKRADIEKWLLAGSQDIKNQNKITIDCYEVTIFPAESVKNSQTVAPKGKDAKNDEYSAWFFDLNGGRTEYVITIACMIGKSRMKGQKVVTNLMPYSPEKPKTGMLRMTGTNQVEIFWDPPKGEFAKYTLAVDHLRDSLSPFGSDIGSVHSHASDFSVGENVRNLQNLKWSLTSYTILGLDPGELYKVELKSKTGNVTCRSPIQENIMTMPIPVKGLMISQVKSASCLIQWLSPSGHSCLKGYQVDVTLQDGKLFKSATVSKNTCVLRINDMMSATDYVVRVTTLCVHMDQRTESVPVEMSISTLPEPVNNIRIENVTHNSAVIKWDSVTTFGALNPSNCIYNLTIQCHDIDFFFCVDVGGDKNQYLLSKLPDPQGSGRKFEVEVRVSMLTVQEIEVQSEIVEEDFYTPPVKPTNVRVDSKKNEIIWTPSETTSVTGYRVRWRADEDGGKAQEIIVPGNSVILPDVKPNTLYRLNIFAMVNFGGRLLLESKELHEKIELDENGVMKVHDDDPS